MGFKSMNSYNTEKNGNFFRLTNDGDYANVIFLYRNTDDVMLADTHYIKSDEYSGYVTCTGQGCPACKKNIRIQSKLFIPMYVLDTSDISGTSDKVLFWDRTTRFQPQLINDVFKSYPNPSDYIFRITRHGMAGDINTKYDIRAIKNNDVATYDQIISRFSLDFPQSYDRVCKIVDFFELEQIISNQNTFNASNSLNNYNAVPRNDIASSIPNTNVPYANQNADNLSINIPTVDLNQTIPEPAPDVEGVSSINVESTNEDIDTTDLDF